MLQQWNTQINIPPISESNHTLTYISGKNIRSCYNDQSLTIQVVQEMGTTADISMAPTTPPLKWLTDKPVWVAHGL